MSDESKLTLRNVKIVELFGALGGLSGLRVNGELVPYLFSPELTWKIADNQTLLEPYVRSYNRAKKALSVQHKVTEGMPVTPQNAESVAAFFSAADELDEREVDVSGLQKINRDKLNVGHDSKKEQNNIPPAVLARLQPILEE